MIFHAFKCILHKKTSDSLDIYCLMEKGTNEDLPCPHKLNTEFPKVCLYSNILYQTSGSDAINVKLLLRMPYIFYCKAIYI